MRSRRLLLAASALSTAFGCSKAKPDPDITEPPPGNPKGSLYDDAAVAPPPLDAGAPGVAVSPADAAAVAPVTPDATTASAPDAAVLRPEDPDKGPPVRIRSNPKGSRYDKGFKP